MAQLHGDNRVRAQAEVAPSTFCLTRTVFDLKLLLHAATTGIIPCNIAQERMLYDVPERLVRDGTVLIFDETGVEDYNLDDHRAWPEDQKFEWPLCTVYQRRTISRFSYQFSYDPNRYISKGQPTLEPGSSSERSYHLVQYKAIPYGSGDADLTTMENDPMFAHIYQDRELVEKIKANYKLRINEESQLNAAMHDCNCRFCPTRAWREVEARWKDAPTFPSERAASIASQALARELIPQPIVPAPKPGPKSSEEIPAEIHPKRGRRSPSTEVVVIPDDDEIKGSGSLEEPLRKKSRLMMPPPSIVHQTEFEPNRSIRDEPVRGFRSPLIPPGPKHNHFQDRSLPTFDPLFRYEHRSMYRDDDSFRRHHARHWHSRDRELMSLEPRHNPLRDDDRDGYRVGPTNQTSRESRFLDDRYPPPPPPPRGYHHGYRDQGGPSRTLSPPPPGPNRYSDYPPNVPYPPLSDRTRPVPPDDIPPPPPPGRYNGRWNDHGSAPSPSLLDRRLQPYEYYSNGYQNDLRDSRGPPPPPQLGRYDGSYPYPPYPPPPPGRRGEYYDYPTVSDRHGGPPVGPSYLHPLSPEKQSDVSPRGPPMEEDAIKPLSKPTTHTNHKR